MENGEPIDKIARLLEFPPETILAWVGKKAVDVGISAIRKWVGENKG